MAGSISTALRVGVDTLRANLLRTALSTLGVVIGVASLVAILAVGDGVEKYGEERIRGEGANVVVVRPNDVETIDGVRVARDSFPVFTAADGASLAGALPAGAAVTMQAQGTGLVARADGGRPRGTVVIGVLQRDDLADTTAYRVVAGRMLTRDETRTNAPVVVLSQRLADSLAAPDSGRALVGRAVRFGTGVVRTVVGVIQPTLRGGGPGGLAIVPVDGAAEVAGVGAAARRPLVPTMQAHAASVSDVPAVRAGAERWAAARWPDWKRQVVVSANFSETRLAQMRQAMGVFRLFMGSVVSISLLVGGIGIMNVLLASVTERTREIGIRKTTGARNRDILRQFLAESVAVSGLGSALGVALGLAGAYGISAIIRAQTGAMLFAAVTLRTLLVAALASIVVGLVFGTYPALRAARLSPIEAIRHE